MAEFPTDRAPSPKNWIKYIYIYKIFENIKFTIKYSQFYNIYEYNLFFDQNFV